MLPTFRVRDLRRPRSPGSGRALMAGPQKSIYDGTVRISAPEYDTTLSDHPEATLKYVDEDDGEIITVGSSLELAQRLGEPVVSSKSKSHHKTVIEPICPAGSEHPVNASLHTFDIYCQGNSLKVWQEIEQRSKQMDVGNATLEELRGLERGKLAGLDMQLSRPLPECERPACVMTPFVRTEYGESGTQSQPRRQSLCFGRDLERSIFTMTPFERTKYAEPATQSQSCKQSSLLQVFEAELAGLSKNQNGLDNTKQDLAGQPSPASPRSRNVLELPGSSGGCASVKKPGDRYSGPVKSSFGGMSPISSTPLKDDSAIASPRVQPIQTLDAGLRTALNSFGTCVHNIADVVQNASTTSQAVAKSTKAVETQLFNDAVQGLRGAAEAIAALGQSFLEKNPANVAKAVAQGPPQTTSSPTKDKSQPCSVVLWPMPDIAALVRNVKIASDIEDMLRLNIKDTVKILISPEKDWGARMVFIKVESEEVAMRVCRHMSCRPYHGRRLNAAIVSAPASGGSDAAILKTKLSDILPSRTYPFPRDSSNAVSKPTKTEAKDTEVASQENLELHTTLESQGNAGNGNSDRLNIPKEYSTVPSESLSKSRSCGPRSTVSEHKTLITESRSRSSPITQSYWESCPLDRERSRSPPRENSGWDLPLRRGSPYRPRFHRPGPIHLPQDEIEVSNTDCAIPLSCGSHVYKETSSPYSKECSPRFSNPAVRDNVRDNRISDRVGAWQMTEKIGGGTTTLSGVPNCLSRLSQAKHHVQGSPRMSPYANSAAPGMFTKTRTSSRSSGTDTYFRRYPFNEPILEPSHNFMPLTDKSKDHLLPVFAPNSDREYQATCGRQTGPSPGHHGGLPSLTGPEKHKCNGHSEQNVVVTPSGAIHSSPSIEAPIQNTSSTLTASRFPTLEQFEGRSFAGSSKYPPLPSMEPLIPQRSCHNDEVWKPHKVNGTAFPLVQSVESAMFNDCPPSLGHRPASSDTNESSGDFFYRMTGLNEEAAKQLELRSTLLRREGLFVPSPELAGRSMSLTETLNQHPHHLFDGVKRHVVEGIKRYATVAGSTNSYVANSRRPYSENFSGNGRLPWESFLRNDASGLNGGSSRPESTGISSHPSTSITDNMGKTTAPSPVEAVAAVSGEVLPGEHNDSSTVAKVQDCVEKLKDLGFGGDSDGSVERLVVYAQAAEGNLSDAIDMIDEEQRAYHEWSW